MKSKPTDIRVQQTVLLKALEDSGNDYECIESVLVENHERYSNKQAKQTYGGGIKLYLVKQIHYFLDSASCGHIRKMLCGKMSLAIYKVKQLSIRICMTN